MKLTFDPKAIQANPNKAFKLFEQKVTKSISRKENVNLKSFYAELGEIGDAFVAQNDLQTMNKGSNRLAELFVNKGYNNIAGIIYSFLIKLNKDNPTEIENLATKALAIAKRYNDPVHIMARCNDLRKIYSITEPQSDKLLKILYTEKRALASICKNYNNAQNRFQTLETKLKPLENYEILLGKVKLQIAEIIKDKSPKEALEEATEAYKILKKHGIANLLTKNETLLSELSKQK